ncbi:MAG: hypothetical protein L0L17_10025, partial [Yaniella sp.]|nr:hypothetical protein [Yaniella sp.]
LAGDSVQITVPSAGGFGHPMKRDAEKVLSDVLDGFTNREAAERDYGVVLKETTNGLEIDEAGTEKLRTAALAVVEVS